MHKEWENFLAYKQGQLHVMLDSTYKLKTDIQMVVYLLDSILIILLGIWIKKIDLTPFGL